MAYFTPIPAKKKAKFPDTSKKEGEIPRYQQKRRRNSPIHQQKRRRKTFFAPFPRKIAAEGKPSRDNRDSGPTSTQLTQGLRPPNLADLLQDRGANRVAIPPRWCGWRKRRSLLVSKQVCSLPSTSSTPVRLQFWDVCPRVTPRHFVLRPKQCEHPPHTNAP